MKLRFTKSFFALYSKLPQKIKDRADKQLRLLLENPKHPSLQFHKMKGCNRWEIYITMNYRVIFEVKDDEYILNKIGKHDILKKK